MSEADHYPATDRTTPTRHADRAHYDVETVHAILDSVLVGHLAHAIDGVPEVLPLLFARIDDRIYLHQSTGGRLARALRGAAGARRLQRRSSGRPGPGAQLDESLVELPQRRRPRFC